MRKTVRNLLIAFAAMLGVIVIAKKPRDPETPPRERI